MEVLFSNPEQKVENNFGSRPVNNAMKRTSCEQKKSGTPLSMNTRSLKKVSGR
jgi:hypothetical protein